MSQTIWEAIKNDLEQIFFEKNVFFDPKIGLFAHKFGKNGVHWGSVYRVNFGFLRFPDPLGVEIMQKILLGKNFWPILAQKDLEKFPTCPPPK